VLPPLGHGEAIEPAPRGLVAVIGLFQLLFKIVKWTVIVVAYLLLGLGKLVAILVVLTFMTARAGVRRLLDAKERSAAIVDADEYDLGYPSPEPSPSPSRDAFDSRWQRERDLRVAERQAGQLAERGARVVSSRSEVGGRRWPE
jgi:hypothetical protein